MSSDTLRDAYAVLLPAIAGMDLEHQFGPLLAAGCQAILIGEERAEYVGRRMSAHRLATETAEGFTVPLGRLRAEHGPFIVAVDQELGGIQRLEGFTPRLPSAAVAATLSDEQIERAVYASARRARELGVTMFLAPIADVVTGSNPWLQDRTLGADAATVTRIASAFARGAMKGGITTVAKHFPGFASLTADPAEEPVSLETDRSALLAGADTFRALIGNGVPAVMTGPAPVNAIDPTLSASLSPRVMEMLRQDFHFSGLIVTDDLDAPATLGDRTLSEAAILALEAGADLLLIGAGPHLHGICSDIAAAVDSGRLARERLSQAAARIRTLATSSAEPASAC
jgi:beta-N-acetylhexosaminidase